MIFHHEIHTNFPRKFTIMSLLQVSCKEAIRYINVHEKSRKKKSITQ